MSRGYDPACLSLAEHFIADDPRGNAEELAGVIQGAAESYLSWQRSPPNLCAVAEHGSSTLTRAPLSAQPSPRR